MVTLSVLCYAPLIDVLYVAEMAVCFRVTTHVDDELACAFARDGNAPVVPNLLFA